ncbi:XRE family transcriptional regulator [Pseudoalteromonas sp. C2R02]|uniref:helix-turn-helix domain-containing protein n=1 Tax=Pseudoalteromonas sp. C2R02 TaxID=2841565 RepID=UPI001C0A4AAA|nr:XRE family transcriptional regulator [Pseudoalteromonas sp. C2R02]MBU2972134.1 XRE family transcriptional regulator [Pseudoalteromonas sp. C2R02]
MKIERTEDHVLAVRLKNIRIEQGLSLDDLAKKSGVSRASLSRIEKGDVSPTAQVLGKLCSAFEITLSRLMLMIESHSNSVIKHDKQMVWQDPETGFIRRSLSPPSKQFSAEVLECELPTHCHIQYDASPTPNLEHHLVLQQGCLEVTIEGEIHNLNPGDCLRYRLNGSSAFKVIGPVCVKYYLTIVCPV